MPLIGKRIDKTYEVSNVYPVTEFDNGVERLFENVKGNLGLTTYRDSDYLNWRFTNNQLNQYEIYVLKSNPDSEKINGYVVLKTYDDGASKKGHIVDILADSKETLSNLLKYSENKFFQNGIQDISTYVMSSSGYFQDFLGNGYAPLTNDISILLKPLSDRFKSKLQADKDMSFHITMMDHDVF